MNYLEKQSKSMNQTQYSSGVGGRRPTRPTDKAPSGCIQGFTQVFIQGCIQDFICFIQVFYTKQKQIQGNSLKLTFIST